MTPIAHDSRPSSFDILNTVDGQIQGTFKATCMALGLLESDEHWNETMREAALAKTSVQRKEIFSLLVANCQMSDPLTLWSRFREEMAEDILFLVRQHVCNIGFSDGGFNVALCLIEDKVMNFTNKPLDEFGFGK